MNPFFQLIRLSPQMKMLLLTSHADDLAYQLCYHLNPPCDGSLDIACYPGEHDSVEHENIARCESIKDYFSPPRSASRDYEAVILQDLLHVHALPLKLLQAVYRSMENSAQIIILQQHGTMKSDEIESLCEKAEFRAANTITDLIDNYDVIVAKKMHMWGNGL